LLTTNTQCKKRPMNVTVKALNENGEEITVKGTEFLARAFCHELDHLDGILYTDKAIYMDEPEDSEPPKKMSPAAYRKYKREHK
ncbi:MAG: peptide deformylase, partial [Clostridia bacterium]|nr:peptide deformylase [Clostridia bacterium]